MDISLEMFIYAQFRTVRNIISYGVFFLFLYIIIIIFCFHFLDRACSWLLGIDLNHYPKPQ
jgi:hypothetical protein